MRAIKVILNELARKPLLTRSEYRVYLFLISNSDDDGLFVGFQGSIADVLKLSRNTINTSMRGLSDKGFIDKILRKDSYSNVCDYKICG